MEFVSIDGLRADGRRPSELRHISCEIGTVIESDGSACMCMGLSKVVSSVHGPTAETDRQRTRDEPRLPTVLCTCLIAPFSGGPRRVRARNDRRTVDLQHLIAGVVQQSIVSDVLASSRIEISVTVVEGHGSMEACAINSAVLAVADAGIPLKELTATCSAGILQGQCALDLNLFEEQTKCARLFLSWQSTLGKAAIIQMYSRMDSEQLDQLMDMAVAGCEQVHKHMHEALAARVQEMAIVSGGYEAQ